MIERLLDRARKPHDAAGLVVFRIVLGAIVSISALRFLAYGWVDDLFVKPTFAFKYWGFSWVHALPAPGMHALFVALAVMGVMFAAGIAHRIVAPLLFVAFAYIQLIDVTNWLNHYYLVSLLLLLSSFMPLGRGVTTVPAWCTWLLRFQVGASRSSPAIGSSTRSRSTSGCTRAPTSPCSARSSAAAASRTRSHGAASSSTRRCRHSFSGAARGRSRTRCSSSSTRPSACCSRSGCSRGS
jgi:hypothetical protein